jgi:hypothetical protein
MIEVVKGCVCCVEVMVVKVGEGGCCEESEDCIRSRLVIVVVVEKGSGSGRKSCVCSAFVGVTEVVVEEEGGGGVKGCVSSVEVVVVMVVEKVVEEGECCVDDGDE